MNNEWEEVKKFHEAFGQPVSDLPALLEPFFVKRRTEWIEEELREFNEATNIVDQADAMIDVIYFALGTLVEMGVKPDGLFSIVQEANMSKLWEDGKARYRPDGKIIKPVGWQAPEPKILKEIERMNREGVS